VIAFPTYGAVPATNQDKMTAKVQVSRQKCPGVSE
jgi:hypothetical protein